MLLRDIVDRYRALAGGFGKPVPLSGFAWSREETERTFAALDEDYHISRFFHLSAAGGELYTINGFPCSHVVIDAEIEGIL